MIDELFNVSVDSTKMDLVSDMIDLQPNLKTIILNPKILLHPIHLIEPWLWKLNTLELRFLRAEKVEDINDAFQALDKNGDGKISVDELCRIAGSGIERFWGYKYGKEYKVSLAKKCEHFLIIFLNSKSDFSKFRVLHSKIQ